jgi:superfamily II DNA helicase RecQ
MFSTNLSGTTAGETSPQKINIFRTTDKVVLSTTSGAKCKICKKTILKDTIRIERLIPNPNFPDKFDNHKYHKLCLQQDPLSCSIMVDSEKNIQENVKRKRQLLQQRNCLLQKLKKLRKKVSEQKQYAPKNYYAFTDAMLEELVIKLPTTKEELLAIHGFGEIRYKLFGEEIFELTREELRPADKRRA